MKVREIVSDKCYIGAPTVIVCGAKQVYYHYLDACEEVVIEQQGRQLLVRKSDWSSVTYYDPDRHDVVLVRRSR